MYRLLIADDEPQIIEGLKRMLNWEALGVSRISTAVTYEEAMQKAIASKPHIAILDVCLEDKRGYDMIHALEAFSLPTKYIMVSGYDEFEFAKKALQAGAKDYLMKPVNREELRRAVEKIITEDFHGSPRGDSRNRQDIDPVLNISYTALSPLTCKVILMIKEEYGQNINLRVIADKFKMNSNYLGQIFSKETHLKFTEYLMVYRLIQARQKILQSTEKIYLIAEQVGYSNVNYFYTHFRNYFGFSPSFLRGGEEDDARPGDKEE